MSQLAPLPSWDSARSLATFHDGGYRQFIDGREMQKCADDLKRYQEIIDDTEPEVIVEVGTRYGGSALWFHTNSSATVVTVDINSQVTKPQLRGDQERGIVHLVGDSTDPALLSNIQAVIAGRRTMVSLDGDHHAPKVWAEIQAYGRLVTRGCFMVVEDACFDMWSGDDARRGGRSIPETGGPLRGMHLAGLEHHPWWKRDEAIEGWTPVSHSPCGWWERR